MRDLWEIRDKRLRGELVLLIRPQYLSLALLKCSREATHCGEKTSNRHSLMRFKHGFPPPVHRNMAVPPLLRADRLPCPRQRNLHRPTHRWRSDIPRQVGSFVSRQPLRGSAQLKVLSSRVPNVHPITRRWQGSVEARLFVCNEAESLAFPPIWAIHHMSEVA
jgi:hypothetical protein